MNRRARIAAPDRRQQIMDAATELFARQGFKGTTTRQIAEHVGVNEALLFRHFSKKEDLYWAIIDHKCRTATGLDRLSAGPWPSADGALFAGIAEDMLRRHEKDGNLLRLVLYTALESHRLSRRFFDTYIAVRYRALAEQIRDRIRRRRFRKMDPVLAARGFIGMVVYHALIEEFFGGKRSSELDTKRVSETIADIWLSGMRQSGPGKRKGDSR